MTRPNAPAPAPSASGTCPRAATWQQSMSLGLLVGTFRRLPATQGSSPGGGQQQSATGAGSSLRVPNAGAPGRAANSTSSTPVPGVLQPDSIASCLVSRGSHAWRADSLSGIDAACAAVSERPLATTGSPARSLPPDRLHGAAGLRGHLDDRSSSPSSGGDYGRGRRPRPGGVGEGRQRHTKWRGHRRGGPADHCVLGHRLGVVFVPSAGSLKVTGHEHAVSEPNSS
jgi:hypothetical protein